MSYPPASNNLSLLTRIILPLPPVRMLGFTLLLTLIWPLSKKRGRQRYHHLEKPLSIWYTSPQHYQWHSSCETRL